MKQESLAPPSRKGFLFLAFTAFFSALFTRLVLNKKQKPGQTVKMLAEDGSLVEIDQNIIVGQKKRISDAELQQWVKKPLQKQNHSL